jgi:E3 ubiquitin-protein ligase TRIP12
VNRYIERVLDVMLEEGVRLPVNAFREGFSRVFPILDLQPFSSEEMLTILGNPNEDWSIEGKCYPSGFGLPD